MNRITALLLLGFLVTPALAPAQTLVAFGDSTTAPRGAVIDTSRSKGLAL